MKNIILTGDRPTGRLHLGHLVGSLSQRVEMQNSGKYDEIFIEIADAQATTDNFGNIQKVKYNVIEVALDYLSCGIDPSKSTIFLQSEVPELSDLTFYYMNLVTLARLERNPTVKQEITYRGFDKSIPVGFMTYPISQAADITAFNANIVPVGDDQLPMIEQTREIVRTFNRLYGDTLVEPKAVLPSKKACFRLIGTDGGAKMSKSIGNCIYLADSPEEVEKKVMGMYTDPNHLKVSDPGNTEGNPVFIYLDAFSKDEHFKKYFKDGEYKNLEELKSHYEKGGLGDIKVKRFLNYVLQDILEPIRLKRSQYEKDIKGVYDILFSGSDKARAIASETLFKVKKAIGLDYRNDEDLIIKQSKKYDN
ncbi:MAG: tryptophan--tRNA ligase [Bacilli bacterium]|nr:tryptophan--tRNA ligase [Bacilli bacterium]